MSEEEKQLLIYLIERRLNEVKFYPDTIDKEYKIVEANYNKLIRKINDIKAD